MFKACFWPQILLKMKFWNLEKTIPKNSHMSPLLKLEQVIDIMLFIKLFHIGQVTGSCIGPRPKSNTAD